MNILEPGYIGKLHIKNRVIMSPMNVGGLNNSDGSLSDRGITYFLERAKGGVGLITTGAVRVTRLYERDSKTIPLWMLFADHKIHTRWISELAEKLHDYDTKLAIQLTLGGGRQAGAYAQNNGLAIGPSENKCFYPPHKYTREMTKEDIRTFLKAFKFSASIIKSAGADAIQLHGHEGYLMDQFTMDLFNHRTDEYGGSLENRLRFVKEIIEAIKESVGTSFPVIYRYGLSHFIEGGRSIEEGLEMAQLLEIYGVDALDIDAGCYENWYLPHPPSTIPAGSMSYLAGLVKKVVSIPVISSGKIHYPEIANRIILEKEADFVSLGRPLIADPEWVNKVALGKIEDIRPCIACHEGCLKRINDFKSISCAVNPCAGNEEALKIIPAVKPKRILIVGGGVSGMVAALTSERKGHDVVLIEKNNYLGSNFKKELLPYFKYDYLKYINYLDKQITNSRVNVLLEHDFSIEDIEMFAPDYIVIASGAQHKKIKRFEGIENVQNISVPDAYSSTSNLGSVNRIVVIGGGLVGVEAALNLAMRGMFVYIIEAKNEILQSAARPNRDHLLKLLSYHNVSVYTNTYITKYYENKFFFCSK